jgi:pimeloyl-ACP methyl ester carboxylesterase
MRARVSHLLEATAVAAVGLTASWFIRHNSARAVRRWRPGRGRFVRAGKLTVRVAGTSGRAFVLLHGLVSSEETFGSAYDRLAEQGQLIVPDLLGFSRSMRDDADGFSLADHLKRWIR